MSIAPQYEHLYHTVEDLEHRVHDSTDLPHDHTAVELHHEIIALQDDIEGTRKPRNLEDRVKQIQALLDKARHAEGTYMSIPDADRYWRIFEQIRMDLRKFPNY